jgi:beta-lactamase superfamily II metal-dependent hydrolase
MGVNAISRLFITNYDEDHISDLPRLLDAVPVLLLHRNVGISPEQLYRLKLESGPISTAMTSLLGMMSAYNTGPPTLPPAFPDVQWSCYHHNYGRLYSDTNNLSLVTFLQCRNKRFFIPGDLEALGWRGMLQNPDFLRDLAGVDVFIAPHHGRESGYYRDAFDFCSPEVIVFSDGPMIHATQEMANTYGAHARGVTFKGRTRRVLSTRNDNTFWWDL